MTGPMEGDNHTVTPSACTASSDARQNKNKTKQKTKLRPGSVSETSFINSRSKASRSVPSRRCQLRHSRCRPRPAT
eukprot:333493-Pleurochrysis_carterae.AAC.1